MKLIEGLNCVIDKPGHPLHTERVTVKAMRPGLVTVSFRNRGGFISGPGASVERPRQWLAPDTDNVFGYGTLRTDLGEYSYPQDGCCLIGCGSIRGQLWRIKNLHGIWAGIKETGKDGIMRTHGQVFKVESNDVWTALDRREGARWPTPAYYRRVVPVAVNGVNGVPYIVHAWVYYINPESCKFLNRIKSGDWRDAVNDPKMAMSHKPAWTKRTAKTWYHVV